MGAAARGGEQPTLEHAWSSMLAIVTMRAGRPCWARRATMSGLLIFWSRLNLFFGEISDACLRRVVSGFQLDVVGGSSVVFSEAGSPES